VPRPLFRSPIRMIDHAHRDTLDFRRGAVKGSTDWLDPEEPSRWYCQGFSSDGFSAPKTSKRPLVALRPDLAAPSGVRERSGSWREKGPGASPGIRNGIRVVRDGSNAAVTPVAAGGIGRKPAPESGSGGVSLDSDTIVL
jgi:hypothetical protein